MLVAVKRAQIYYGSRKGDNFKYLSGRNRKSRPEFAGNPAPTRLFPFPLGCALSEGIFPLGKSN